MKTQNSNLNSDHISQGVGSESTRPELKKSSGEIIKILVSDLSEMRYKEMMTLFNNKSYEEGIVRTENHARTYLYFPSFSNLSDENIKELLQIIEDTYPNLKGALYLRNYKNKKFISIEPLFPNSLEKEVAKELADMIRGLLQKMENQMFYN